MIEKYINSIMINKKLSEDYETDIDVWSFWGDGIGDFEKIGDSATLQTLQNYKEYCNEQIALCDEYIISEYSKSNNKTNK
jgi:hypothetical protein